MAEKHDVFHIEYSTSKPVVEYIWPTSKGGSTSKENEHTLALSSHHAKAEELTGTIGGIKFKVEEAGKDSSGKIIGTMLVEKEGKWVHAK